MKLAHQIHLYTTKFTLIWSLTGMKVLPFHSFFSPSTSFRNDSIQKSKQAKAIAQPQTELFEIVKVKRSATVCSHSFDCKSKLRSKEEMKRGENNQESCTPEVMLNSNHCDYFHGNYTRAFQNICFCIDFDRNLSFFHPHLQTFFFTQDMFFSRSWKRKKCITKS